MKKFTKNTWHWKNARYFKKYYRHPKTLQERKQFISDKIDHDLNNSAKVRQKRSWHMLPTEYSDIHRGDVKVRSWKKLTKNKKQYRNKPNNK